MDHSILIYVLLGSLAIGLLISVYTDIRHRLILNAVTAPIALAAPLYWYAVGDFNITDIAIHCAVAAAVFVFFALMFRFGAMGGGDVKLFSALALWFTPIWVMRMLIVATVLGALVTIVFWLIHRLRHQVGPVKVPYGVAIAVAGLWVAGEQIFNHFG